MFPVFTGKSNFWALEQALIQLWQPKLNTPFIFEFFNSRKGLIQKQKFSAHRQFGVFSLWRKLRWRTTPQKIRSSLRSKTFYDRVELWSIIQDLGANSLRRFQMEKRIRSNDFGLQGCYMIRKLAINLGEPQRSYCLQAIDRAIKFWKGPAVRRRLPLRAPWLLTPGLEQTPAAPHCGSHSYYDSTQHHVAITFHVNCLYQIPFSHGQPVQPQGHRDPMGRSTNTLVHLFDSVTVLAQPHHII